MNVVGWQEMNDHGSACMSRMLTALQPALGQLGSPTGTFWPGATRHFERARNYYALLPQPTDAILRAAGSKPARFSQSEWMALLQVHSYDTLIPQQVSVLHRKAVSPSKSREGDSMLLDTGNVVTSSR